MNAYFMMDQIETFSVKPSDKFKKQKFYSSIIFAITFFLVRMVWGNYHYYLFITFCFQVWGEVYAWMNISLLSLIFVAFFLNSTWMYQIVKSGLSILSTKDKEE